MGTAGRRGEFSVGKQLRILLGMTGVILLLPLVAMQFAGEVAWSGGDFVAAGILLLGTGTLYIALARLASTRRQRLLIGSGLGCALLVVWLELALGIFH